MIILTGPTAVGKTSLSIHLAKSINGEIISADSMQVYRKMNIGTAKIKPEEMGGVKHYLIDIIDPKEEFNVVKFKAYAQEAIHEIYEKNKIPIIVGGTGFYIQALLKDVSFASTKEDSGYREYLQQLAEQKGASYLHELLRKVDEESSIKIHQNNVKRVIRALEYYHQTGEKISQHNDTEKARKSPYDFLYYVLTHDRNVLYQRINERIDRMIQEGLVEEVRGLYQEGYRQNLVSMQGLGYKELFNYFDGQYSLEEAIEILKRDTRHFAKRQLTWFRREEDIRWLDKSNYKNEQEILEEILRQVNEKGWNTR